MADTNLGRVMPVDKGAYSAETTYAKLDMVHTADSTYVSKVDNNVGHAVTDTDYWTCYASGVAATTAAANANTKAGLANDAATAANNAATAANAAAALMDTPFDVSAEHLAKLWEELQALKDHIDELGDAHARSLTLDALFKICGQDFFTSGAGAPAVAGVCKFAEYHDTTNNKFYKYNGSSWVVLN